MALALLLTLALAAAPAPAAAPVAAPAEGDVPAGAPADDYGLVSWCRGALTGHMELYPVVKPELDKVSPGESDEAQMAAGREYLALYKRAIEAAEKADPRGLRERGQIEEQKGYRSWAQVRATEPRNRMWAWLGWELPGRCESAANRLERRSDLFGVALRSDGAAPQAPAATPAAPEPEAAGLRDRQ